MIIFFIRSALSRQISINKFFLCFNIWDNLTEFKPSHLTDDTRKSTRCFYHGLNRTFSICIHVYPSIFSLERVKLGGYSYPDLRYLCVQKFLKYSKCMRIFCTRFWLSISNRETDIQDYFFLTNGIQNVKKDITVIRKKMSKWLRAYFNFSFKLRSLKINSPFRKSS